MAEESGTGRRGHPMTKRRKKPPRGKRGRPSIYNASLGATICERLAAGEPLRAICRDTGMPAEATVRLWGHDAKHVFSAQYARARELGFWAMADEMLEIADDARNDWMEKTTKSGKTITVLNEEAISRSRLRIDARKWLISKALPKDFGERLAAEISGRDGKELIPEREQSPRDLARAVIDILRCARIAPPAEPDEGNRHDGEAEAPAPLSPIARFNAQTGRLEYDA
jgi:hypothetical protein